MVRKEVVYKIQGYTNFSEIRFLQGTTIKFLKNEVQQQNEAFDLSFSE